MTGPTPAYLVNTVTRTMHQVYREADGRLSTMEQCNVDSIPESHRAIFDEPQTDLASKVGIRRPVRRCGLCFPDGQEAR